MLKIESLSIAKKTKSVAFCSISPMQSCLNSGAFQEERSKHWPSREPTQRQARPAGIRHGSTPGSGRVRRAGWLWSSWQQRASPQGASLGSGVVAPRASTPATPELLPAFEPCPLFMQNKAVLGRYRAGREGREGESWFSGGARVGRRQGGGTDVYVILSPLQGTIACERAAWHGCGRRPSAFRRIPGRCGRASPGPARVRARQWRGRWRRW